MSTATATKPKTELLPDSPLWAWAQEAISHRIGEMFSHVSDVRRGEDIEAVHQMRVGSRRLVAAMKVFAVCFPDDDYRKLLREARDVTRRLGAVRDLEVLIDFYEKLRPEAKSGELIGIDYFIAVQKREWKRARKPLLAALKLMEKDRLGERIASYLQDESAAYRFGLHAPAARSQTVAPTGSFRDAAPPILEDRYNVFYGFREYVDDPEEVEQLHEMRIAAKWLRYTMELFAPAYADELDREITAVKKMQELLGDLHDSDIRLDILEAMVEQPPSLEGLETVGVLLPDPVMVSLRQLQARERKTRRDCYKAFHKEWKKLEKKEFARKCLEQIRRPDA